MTPDDLHPSVAAGVADRRTTTDAGVAIISEIEGVIAHRVTVHTDHRGRLFEVHNGSLPHSVDPVVHGYVFSIRPAFIKGWGIHLKKDDRYTILSGEVLTVLFDARKDSPSSGRSARYVLGPSDHQQLRIPAGVWHASINLGQSEASLLNLPTLPYDHAAPDRIALPWDTDAIAVDLRALLPRRF